MPEQHTVSMAKAKSSQNANPKDQTTQAGMHARTHALLLAPSHTHTHIRSTA